MRGFGRVSIACYPAVKMVNNLFTAEIEIKDFDGHLQKVTEDLVM